MYIYTAKTGPTSTPTSRVQLPSPREQRLPLRRVRLLPTTTRERLPPLRPVNDYFHYELVLSGNARFKGITQDDRDEMPLHV